MNIKVRLLKILLITLASIVLVSCGSKESGKNLAVKYLAFVPATKTIKVGTTLTWINDDQTAHTVMSKKMFNSKPLNPGQSFSFKFTKKGKHAYMCKIHPYMKAKVIVE